MQECNFFHLSHTDLDGYACQMITKSYFKNIYFFNSNYGKEISERFNEIIDKMERLGASKNVILITDLNLTLDQCESFEKKLRNAACEAKLLLLDHHKSGHECFLKYPWYFLDESRCATKISYDFFASMYGENEDLRLFSDVVNAVDIWLSESEYFELGKVGLGLVAMAKEINRIMFASDNSEYIFSLLENSQKYFKLENAHIALDDAVHGIKKDFFKEDKDDTLSNLVSAYMVKLLQKHKNKMTIKYLSYKGILTYNIGNVSVIGNDFLVKNEDYDFFMDVTSRKTVSFRSNNKADVSAIAKKVANGGGHPNASGGAIPSFKDSFLYEKVIRQIQNILDEKAKEI
ncbi:MAG: 3'-to-5' oligoribonuclease B [Proteobacteria bacterium]|nr:MAG: 3'-to-5' oligoribonuclease B [Pseudomonadota bacterium]